jgi:hypothetical protein
MFLLRFPIMISVMTLIMVYSEEHGWGLASFILAFGLLLALISWFLVERIAWNHDLRGSGLSNGKDSWNVTQFPEN